MKRAKNKDIIRSNKDTTYVPMKHGQIITQKWESQREKVSHMAFPLIYCGSLPRTGVVFIGIRYGCSLWKQDQQILLGMSQERCQQTWSFLSWASWVLSHPLIYHPVLTASVQLWKFNFYLQPSLFSLRFCLPFGIMSSKKGSVPWRSKLCSANCSKMALKMKLLSLGFHAVKWV